MNTEAWLLLAHIVLATGEPVDVLISTHTSEAECIHHIMTTVPAKRGRRYDCKPLVLMCQDLKP